MKGCRIDMEGSIFEGEYYETEEPTRCRGRECRYFNLKPFDDIYVQNPPRNFCGLHGCASVELGMPVNLDGEGGCGFVRRELQLTLF